MVTGDWRHDSRYGSVRFDDLPQRVGGGFGRNVAVDGNGQKDPRIKIVSQHGFESRPCGGQR